MAEPLTVNIADLRTALGRELDATENRLGPQVALDTDYYWHLDLTFAETCIRDVEPDDGEASPGGTWSMGWVNSAD